MKFLIIIFFFISSSNLLASFNIDSIKYMNAYKYIIEDSNYINKVFYEHLNEKIELCVSDEIVYIPKGFFIDEMIEYEYPCLNNVQKKKLRYELYKSDMLDSFSTFRNSNFQTFGKNPNCNIKVFFSKIIENKLMVTILESKDSDEYSEVFTKGYTVLFYLFYFDNDHIEMVLKENVYK